MSVIRNCIFGKQCDKKWDELVTTDNQDIRYCSTCEQNVYLCQDEYILADAIQANRCVAVDIAENVRLVGEPLPLRYS
ncbi:hypothetical protein [Methylomonas koyamae]|uniref:hypothetical protein n=1 Tax=Methylomonas koyamae TaxID=702114 RepID=UPI000B33D7C5|nr:hypothetical protein [Methylomonas koyamae]BBL57525.1 hypothetical protein MKFW12EY_11380 [Methylomonas koyamae]